MVKACFLASHMSRTQIERALGKTRTAQLRSVPLQVWQKPYLLKRLMVNAWYQEFAEVIKFVLQSKVRPCLML